MRRLNRIIRAVIKFAGDYRHWRKRGFSRSNAWATAHNTI